MSLLSSAFAWLRVPRVKENRRVVWRPISTNPRRSLRLAVEQLECRELLSGLGASILGMPASGQSPVGTPIHLAASLQGATFGVAYTFSWQVLTNNATYATGSASTFSFTPDDHGSFTVDLAVSDKFGDNATANATLTVNAVAPTAHLVSSFTGTALVPLVFNATATDPSSVDTAAGFTYTWNFGDNSTGSGASPSHAYANPGNYAVTLTVTDENGQQATAKTTAYVHLPPAPGVTITGVPASGLSPVATAITLGSNLTHTTANDTYTLTWQVRRFGILYTTGSGSSVTFTPDDSGSYWTYLTVTDQFGTKATAARGIWVYDLPPTVQVAPSFNGAALSPLTFTATATDPSPADTAAGFRFLWYFGDGAGAWGAAPTHTYARPGTYTVHVYAYDKHGLYGSAITHATIIKAITASFTGPRSVTAGTTNATVAFTNVAGGSGSGYTYSFDFGNTGTFEVSGSTTASATVPESYVDDGPANVVVRGRITDGLGNYRDFTTAIQVSHVAPAPQVVLPSVIEAHALLTYSATVTDPSQHETAKGFIDRWNFGDGTGWFTGQSIQHAYAHPGNYTVTLTVIDSMGAPATVTAVVSVAPAPAASFSGPGSVSEGTTNAQVSFSNATGGAGGYTYSYDFGNTGTFEVAGSTNSAATIPESYVDDSPAPVTVHGRITDSAGGYSDYLTKITVSDVAPTPSISAPSSTDAGIATAFQASATSPSTADTKVGFSYHWNFGDGTGSVSGAEPTHAFAAAGTYTVALTAVDAVSGMVAGSTTTSITVNPPPSASFGGPSSVNEGTTTAQVAFTNVTGGTGGYTYGYDFGNTGRFEITGSTSATATVPESYVDTAGTLVVRGRITDSAGRSTDYTTNITITAVAPTAALSNNGPVNPSIPVTVSFTNASDPSNAETVAGFHYSFAKVQSSLAATYGAAGTATSAQFTFASSGTYTIYGRIFDAENAYTDYTTQVTVNVPAQLTVVLQTTGANVGAEETFLASVSGPYTGSLKYSWNFGDGNTQTSTSPLVSYTYASAGTFTATVTVTDSAGDRGTGSATVTVTSTPLQPVTLDGTSFGLVGSAVNFSVSNPNLPPAGGFTYAWNFGDGATGSTTTPAESHAYSTAGNYVATVTVSDAHGDTLYASAAVTVNPASSSTDPLYKPVVNANSFSYLGSFALPTSANNWDTAYSYGGLAYRYVNGKLQFFTTNHVYSGGLVYEFNYPGIGTDQNNLPQAQVVTNWGDIYTGKKEFGGDGTLDPSTWTYGLYYDQSSGHLYWTYGNAYNATYLYNPTIGYSTLNNATGVATGVGAWSLANRPEKMDRGGIVQIPQWFANRYTNGATLGVGFGGYFSINATASMGAALAAIAPPNLSANPNTSALPNIPLLGYPNGGADRGHRDTQYTSYYDGGSYPGTPGYWNPANGAGYWTWSDTIFDGGTWIDTPTIQGVLFIAKVGQGNVYYQNSDRNAQSGAFEWMVYNPADLAAVASGAKQQWQIQPVYEWTTSTLQFGPYDQQGFGGDGTSDVGGVVFDPTTNRLYVLEEGVLSNGYEAWPEMYVYQVGAPPSTPGSAVVVSDGQAGFSKSGSGWSNTPNGYGGESMQTTALTTATASWQVAALPPAYYALSVDWNAMPNTNTTAAVYKIYDGTTLVQTVTIDQSQTSSGKVVGGTIFQSLGKFQITSGSLRVVLSNGASASLSADALLVEPSSGP